MTITIRTIRWSSVMRSSRRGRHDKAHPHVIHLLVTTCVLRSLIPSNSTLVSTNSPTNFSRAAGVSFKWIAGPRPRFNTSASITQGGTCL
jgi:hypothetical protein